MTIALTVSGILQLEHGIQYSSYTLRKASYSCTVIILSKLFSKNIVIIYIINSKFCLNIPFGRNCIEQEDNSKKIHIAYLNLFYCFILSLGYQKKVLDGLQNCKNIYTYSKDSEQLKIIHFQKNSRIAPIVLEAKAGYIMTTNRTPRDFVTSKEIILFFKHTSIFHR